MKDIVYSRKAQKALTRMPRNLAERIIGKIDVYATMPEALAQNVTALKGSDLVRLRVGDWRVILRDDVVIDVINIAPRGDVYD